MSRNEYWKTSTSLLTTSMCLHVPTACRSTQLHLLPEAGTTRLPAAVWLTSYNIVSPAFIFSLQRNVPLVARCHAASLDAQSATPAGSN